MKSKPGIAKSYWGYIQRLALFIALLSSFSFINSTSYAANLYGIVIGINDYLGDANDLGGAVNDAKDIHASLKQAGAKKIELFLDGDATKRNIKSAWDKIVAEAKAGDTIIFTYAGHGYQEDEPPGRNGEKDGKNETFLLAKYNPNGAGSEERIVDDELFEWTKKADDKGIQVILVADSCHSGTMHRSAGNKKIRYRTGDFEKITNDQLKYPGKETAHLTEKSLKLMTFVSATSDDRLTPEITINNRYRGALSWSFARALEGAADHNGDGAVSQLELLGYIVPAVKAHVENQQSPQIQPLRAATRPLFLIKEKKGGFMQSLFTKSISFGSTRAADFTTLKVGVIGGSSSSLKNIPSVSVVSNTQEADVVWNVSQGTVVHNIGGLVAENVTPDTVKYVISKWATLKLLKAKTIENPLTTSLLRGDHRYRKGDLVEIKVSDIRYPYLTLFNLPPDGKVEFFLPNPNRASDATKDWRDQSYYQKFRVTHPPYGAEHLVAIYSSQVLNSLHAALATMRKPEDASALRQVLNETLKDKKYQVGILSIYTGQ